MINQMKSYYAVYKPAVGIALIICFLLFSGTVGGYFIAKSADKKQARDLNEIHLAEISRIQTSNQNVIVYLTTRMQELIEEQSRLAALVSDGVRQARGYAKSAADSSKSAVTDGPKSKITITEIPPDAPPAVDDKHQFPERIEH